MSFYLKYIFSFSFSLAFTILLNAQLTKNYDKIEVKITSISNNPPKMWKLIYKKKKKKKKNKNEEGLLNAYKKASVYAEHLKNFKKAENA